MSLAIYTDSVYPLPHIMLTSLLLSEVMIDMYSCWIKQMKLPKCVQIKHRQLHI